jgi:predicted dehydrogenase
MTIGKISFVTDDYDALLARKDMDVLEICVPPALDHEFGIRAAGAGKHIIMQKPLTGSALTGMRPTDRWPSFGASLFEDGKVQR